MKQVKTYPTWIVFATIPIITLIVYRTGSYESWLTFLYLIPIIWASLFISLNVGVNAAVFSCALYMIMVALDLNELIPHYSLLPTDITTFRERILFVGTSVLFDKLLIFLALAALIGHLAENLRKKNRSLALEKNKIQRIFESLEEAVMVTDDKGKVLALNSAAKRIFTVTKNRSVKGKLSDLKLEEKLLTLGELSHPPLEVSFRNRKEIYEGVIVPLFVGDSVIGRILTCRDVTHKKQIERMKSDFIAFLSHQLRSPLSNLKLYVEELLSKELGGLKKEQSESLDVMGHQIERLIELVNYFLDLETIKSGQLKIHAKPHHAEDLVVDVLQEYKGEKLNLKFDRPKAKLPEIVFDRMKVEEVFRNILKNSIKYLKNGHGKIIVSVDKISSADLHKKLKGNWQESAPVPIQFLKILNPKKQKGTTAWYDISIADNGIGIPKRDQDMIFSELFRAENAKQEEGMGMGLFLSKAIMVSLGGKICFESREGKGSTFHVLIPAVKPKKS